MVLTLDDFTGFISSLFTEFNGWMNDQMALIPIFAILFVMIASTSWVVYTFRRRSARY